MAEQTPGRRFPRPPKVEGDFAQRFECRGKGRNYIINLERRHQERRSVKLAKNSRVGKFPQRRSCITRAKFSQTTIRRGARARPSTNPVTKPHKCADVLT